MHIPWPLRGLESLVGWVSVSFFFWKDLLIQVIIIFSFFRFEDDKDVSDQFSELWDENVGSENITLQLYSAEIISVLHNCISGSSWASKRKVRFNLFPIF